MYFKTKPILIVHEGHFVMRKKNICSFFNKKYSREEKAYSKSRKLFER
jgi:hypothetical protein